jgi:hypothetical protein
MQYPKLTIFPIYVSKLLMPLSIRIFVLTSKDFSNNPLTEQWQILTGGSQLMTRKNYRSSITWLILSIAAVTLGGGWWAGFAYFKDLRKAPIEVSLMPPGQGDVKIIFSEAGMIELNEQSLLNATLDETVEKVLS